MEDKLKQIVRDHYRSIEMTDNERVDGGAFFGDHHPKLKFDETGEYVEVKSLLKLIRSYSLTGAVGVFKCDLDSNDEKLASGLVFGFQTIRYAIKKAIDENSSESQD